MKKISYENCTCTEGKCYNNADETSGQWDYCEECDYEQWLEREAQAAKDREFDEKCALGYL